MNKTTQYSKKKTYTNGDIYFNTLIEMIKNRNDYDSWLDMFDDESFKNDVENVFRNYKSVKFSCKYNKSFCKMDKYKDKSNSSMYEYIEGHGNMLLIDEQELKYMKISEQINLYDSIHLFVVFSNPNVLDLNFIKDIDSIVVTYIRDEFTKSKKWSVCGTYILMNRIFDK